MALLSSAWDCIYVIYLVIYMFIFCDFVFIWKLPYQLSYTSHVQ